MQKIQPGLWVLEDTRSIDDLYDLVIIDDQQFMLLGSEHGVAHLRSRNRAAAALFDYLEDRALLESGAATGQPASVLADKPDGSVFIYQGRLGTWGGDKLVLFKHGSLHKGYDLDELHVLAWEFGDSDQVRDRLRRAWLQRQKQVPQLAVSTFDRIPEYNPVRESSPPVSAVFLVDHPGFGEEHEMATAGVLFFALDVQSEDQIVNGFLWAPQDSPMVSEHGSQYYLHLAQHGGRVMGFPRNRVSFGELLDGAMPPDRAGAYAWLSRYVKEGGGE